MSFEIIDISLQKKVAKVKYMQKPDDDWKWYRKAILSVKKCTSGLGGFDYVTYQIHTSVNSSKYLIHGLFISESNEATISFLNQIHTMTIAITVDANNICLPTEI